MKGLKAERVCVCVFVWVLEYPRSSPEDGELRWGYVGRRDTMATLTRRQGAAQRGPTAEPRECSGRTGSTVSLVINIFSDLCSFNILIESFESNKITLYNV